MADLSGMTLGFIGGTGAEGAGLALRYALAGFRVAIGSRSQERASAAAAAINLSAGRELASAHENPGAAHAADIVLVTVPYEGLQETLASLKGAIGSKIVLTAVVPLVFRSGRPLARAVPAGSATQEAQETLPEARVVGAFHHLGAKHLADLGHPIEGDVLVCGDDNEAKETAIQLIERLKDLRAIDAGGLAYAPYIENFTAVLLSMNRKYKAQSGLRITGLEK